MKIIVNDIEYISQSDVLKLMECKRHKLYELINKNEISEPLKPDPRAFWKLSEIESYIEKSRK